MLKEVPYIFVICLKALLRIANKTSSTIHVQYTIFHGILNMFVSLNVYVVTCLACLLIQVQTQQWKTVLPVLHLLRFLPLHTQSSHSNEAEIIFCVLLSKIYIWKGIQHTKITYIAITKKIIISFDTFVKQIYQTTMHSIQKQTYRPWAQFKTRSVIQVSAKGREEHIVDVLQVLQFILDWDELWEFLARLKVMLFEEIKEELSVSCTLFLPFNHHANHFHDLKEAVRVAESMILRPLNVNLDVNPSIITVT